MPTFVVYSSCVFAPLRGHFYFQKSREFFQFFSFFFISRVLGSFVSCVISLCLDEEAVQEESDDDDVKHHKARGKKGKSNVTDSGDGEEDVNGSDEDNEPLAQMEEEYPEGTCFLSIAFLTSLF